MRLILCIFLFGVLGCSSTIQPSKTLKKEEIVFSTISKGTLFGNGIEGILEEKFTITNEKQWQVFLNKINSVNNVFIVMSFFKTHSYHILYKHTFTLNKSIKTNEKI